MGEKEYTALIQAAPADVKPKLKQAHESLVTAKKADDKETIQDEQKNFDDLVDGVASETDERAQAKEAYTQAKKDVETETKAATAEVKKSVTETSATTAENQTPITAKKAKVVPWYASVFGYDSKDDDLPTLDDAETVLADTGAGVETAVEETGNIVDTAVDAVESVFDKVGDFFSFDRVNEESESSEENQQQPPIAA